MRRSFDSLSLPQDDGGENGLPRQSEDWLAMTYRTTTAKTNREGPKDVTIIARLTSRRCPPVHMVIPMTEGGLQPQ